MNAIPPRRRRQSGVTLVELMIALVLGLIVTLVVGQVYLSGRQSYRTQTGFSGMQEGGRFALYFLQRDIRLAGFPRSLGPGGATPVLNGFTPPPTTCNGCVNGSDQIEIQYNPFGNAPIPDSIPAGMVGTVTGNSTFAASQNDCLGATLAAGTTIVNTYFVDATGNLACRGNGNAAAQPIVPGVESFQVLYGEDTDDDTYANIYRPADGVGNWANVVAVRVGMLINSGEVVLDRPDTAQYAVLDAPPITPVDNPGTPLDERRFARRVFTTTIQVRNRSTL